jgi:hypothetical protein
MVSWWHMGHTSTSVEVINASGFTCSFSGLVSWKAAEFDAPELSFLSIMSGPDRTNRQRKKRDSRDEEATNLLLLRYSITVQQL